MKQTQYNDIHAKLKQYIIVTARYRDLLCRTQQRWLMSLRLILNFIQSIFPMLNLVCLDSRGSVNVINISSQYGDLFSQVLMVYPSSYDGVR